MRTQGNFYHQALDKWLRYLTDGINSAHKNKNITWLDNIAPTPFTYTDMNTLPTPNEYIRILQILFQSVNAHTTIGITNGYDEGTIQILNHKIYDETIETPYINPEGETTPMTHTELVTFTNTGGLLLIDHTNINNLAWMTSRSLITLRDKIERITNDIITPRGSRLNTNLAWMLCCVNKNPGNTHTHTHTHTYTLISP